MSEKVLEKAQRTIGEGRARLARQRSLCDALDRAAELQTTRTTQQLILDMEGHRAEFERRLREANARLDKNESKKVR